ncbi:unnamed protein product [Prunus armeniaca]
MELRSTVVNLCLQPSLPVAFNRRCPLPSTVSQSLAVSLSYEFEINGTLAAQAKLFLMAKRLVPLLNRVLVEKIISPSKTNAGILLPEKSTKELVTVAVILQ